MNKDVKQIIEKIAEKLGTTSEFLYTKMVKQAKLNALTTLIQLIFGFLIGVVLVVYTAWQVKLGLANFDEVNKYFGIYVTLGIVDVIIILAYIFTMFERFYYGIDEIIKSWKNPEGTAIDELFNMFD